MSAGSTLLALAADLPVRSFAAGEALVTEGDAGGAIHVLLEGDLEVRVGDQLVVTLREPGSMVGETSVLLERPATATVVAATEVRTHVVQDAAAALVDQPELALAIARRLARRVTAMTSYLVDLREQYADAEGHLGMMDTVLSALMVADHRPADSGSDRDVPGY